MYSARHQAGVTAIGIFLMLIPNVLLGYMIVRGVPAYIEAYTIGDALNSLKKEIDLKDKSKEDIYKMIQKRFEVNNIQSVKRDDVKIEKKPAEVSVETAYEAKVPVFGNISLAFSFHKRVVVR